MSESTEYRPTSRLARVSSGLGLLALFSLLFAYFIVGLGFARGRAQGPTQEDAIILGLALLLLLGIMVVAAPAALVLGILGLVQIRRGAGKVRGTGRAVTGLVTATLTLLTLMVWLGLVRPALGREAAKMESSNNLKELGLAILYHSYEYKRLPSPVLRDRSLGGRGQPYSWRVAILPYLGEKKLYSQYRRDEPWDSPANKAVLARMPRVFAPPGHGRGADGLTHYQLLVGPGTVFENPEKVVTSTQLAALPRGGADTILVVEAAEPVPWTKPQDLPYEPNGPLPRLGGLVGNGFHAMFADASVRWIDGGESEKALRALITRDGR